MNLEKKAEISPLPWTLAYGDALRIHANDNGETYRFGALVDSEYDTGRKDYERTREDIANAAFIVRAVNAHEELLNAVRFMLGILERHYKATGVRLDAGRPEEILKQAIAKAEGR